MPAAIRAGWQASLAAADCSRPEKIIASNRSCFVLFNRLSLPIRSRKLIKVFCHSHSSPPSAHKTVPVFSQKCRSVDIFGGATLPQGKDSYQLRKPIRKSVCKLQLQNHFLPPNDHRIAHLRREARD